MSQTPGSFRPTELSGADRSPSDGELATAWSIARELEASLPPETVGPSPGFADAVMAAVAREPAPRRAGFLAALRSRPGVGGFAASFREAWTVASGGPGRPAGARGLALAYVLAVVVIGTSITGFAAYGAAGALGFLDGDRSPSPSVVVPSPTPSPSLLPSPLPSPEPSRIPDASTSPEPSRTPDASTSPSPRASSPAGPSASPKESDDHGGSSPSTSPDDGSSPEPSRTPRPSDDAKASETPH